MPSSGAVFCIVKDYEMPRNGGGVFSLAEPPFIPNTVISSAAVNSDFSDIADALTASLARDGQGGMTGTLPLASGGVVYLSDPNTGLRRSAADTQEIFGGGIALATIGPTEVNFSVPVKQNGSPLNFIGQVAISSLTNTPPLWLATGATYLRATYPALWAVAQAEIALGNTFYNNGNGTTTFGIAGMEGHGAVGVDTSGLILPGVTVIGAGTGAATKPIAQANLPNVTFTTNINDPQHRHSISLLSQGYNVGLGGVQLLSTNSGSPVTPLTEFAPTSITASTPSGGSGTPLNVVQPSRAFKFIVYAGV